MYAANSHVIRYATAADAMELRRMAAASGRAPLNRPVLIGEIAGRPAAAVSLIDMRTIDDGWNATGRLTSLLLMRARATVAHRSMPSLRERLIAYLPWGRSYRGAAASEQAA